jgi:hypothetical protein
MTKAEIKQSEWADRELAKPKSKAKPLVRVRRVVRPRLILFSDRKKLANKVTAWQLKNGVAQNTLSTLTALQIMGRLQSPK